MELAKLIRIPKGNGFRQIYVPSESFKKRLRKCLPTLLDIFYINQAHPNACHAFLPNRNCITNAEQHIGFDYNLSIDILNFFDSIKPWHVQNKVPQNIINECFIKGAPRQGLPSSPLISNIALIDVDNEIISRVSKFTNDFAYTRYADDIAISVNCSHLIYKAKFIVKEVLSNHGFNICRKKTKVQAVFNGRLIITGVGVDKDGIYPTRKTLKKIRAASHQANESSYRGLVEWSKCKLPTNKMKIKFSEPTFLTDEMTTCKYCGTSNLIWSRVDRWKKQLYSIESNTLHDCSVNKITHVIDHLIKLGFVKFKPKGKRWHTALYSLNGKVPAIFFRKNGVDVYSIDFDRYYLDVLSQSSSLNQADKSHLDPWVSQIDQTVYCDGEIVNKDIDEDILAQACGEEIEEWYEFPEKDFIDYDSSLQKQLNFKSFLHEEFFRYLTSDILNDEILKNWSEYCHRLAKIDYKVHDVKVHELLLAFENVHQLASYFCENSHLGGLDSDLQGYYSMS